MWTYAPSEVTVAFAGKHFVGFSDGSFVRITRVDPLYTSKRAMDGEVSVTQQTKSIWKVTVTLQQTSETNSFLSGVQRILIEKNITAFRWLPLIIKDNSGSTMFFAKDVWIENVPETTFADDMQTREWVFACNEAVMNLGSNSEDEDDITKAIAAAGFLLDIAGNSSTFIKDIRRAF